MEHLDSYTLLQTGRLNHPPAPLQAVTLQQVLRAIRKYVRPLFDPAKSIGSVTCGANRFKDFVVDFKAAGYKVTPTTFR